MLVDTHTHFYDEWLLPDAEAAIQRALDAGVGKMIQADIDSVERPRMWEIGLRHPGVLFQMAGLYPGSVTTENWQYELDQVHRIVSGDFSTPPSAPLEMTEDLSFRPSEASGEISLIKSTIIAILVNYLYLCRPQTSGELSEWLKEPASKTGLRASATGVRIPHSPQSGSKKAH